MTQEYDAYIHEEDSRPRWQVPLIWSMVLVVGWVLYELTAQPALGVAAICLKFGWEDLRTALWLRKKDDYRARAWACFWLYLASALWKAAITASAMLLAFGILKAMGVIGPAQPLIGAVLVAFVGIVLTTVLACLAAAIALRRQLKLWLGSSMHSARRHDRWPPDIRTWQGNAASMLITSSLIGTAVATLPLAVAAIVSACMGPLRQDRMAAGIALFGTVGLFLVVIPLVAVPLRRMLNRRVFADSPEECWDTQAISTQPGHEYNPGNERRTPVL